MSDEIKDPRVDTQLIHYPRLDLMTPEEILWKVNPELYGYTKAIDTGLLSNLSLEIMSKYREAQAWEKVNYLKAMVQKMKIESDERTEHLWANTEIMLEKMKSQLQIALENIKAENKVDVEKEITRRVELIIREEKAIAQIEKEKEVAVSLIQAENKVDVEKEITQRSELIVREEKAIAQIEKGKEVAVSLIQQVGAAIRVEFATSDSSNGEIWAEGVFEDNEKYYARVTIRVKR